MARPGDPARGDVGGGTGSASHVPEGPRAQDGAAGPGGQRDRAGKEADRGEDCLGSGGGPEDPGRVLDEP